METNNAEAAPGERLDLRAVDDDVDAALAIPLSRDERPLINRMTQELITGLRLLLKEDLGHDLDDLTVRNLYADAYRLLDLKRRPVSGATTFNAWGYMRDVAMLTRRIATVYRDQYPETETDG